MSPERIDEMIHGSQLSDTRSMFPASLSFYAYRCTYEMYILRMHVVKLNSELENWTLKTSSRNLSV
jgi:hypothetical protein